MIACVLMRNMIMEDEGEVIRQVLDFDIWVTLSSFWSNATAFEQVFQVDHHIRNRAIHTQLHNDLMEHV